MSAAPESLEPDYSDRNLAIGDYAIRVTDFASANGDNPAMSATVLVQPPITVGNAFEHSIMGQSSDFGSIKHVLNIPPEPDSPGGTTVMVATANGETTYEKIENIIRIAKRVGTLATNPHQASTMMYDYPLRIN